MKLCPFLAIANSVGNKNLTNCSDCLFQVKENKTGIMHCAIILAATKSVETKELIKDSFTRQGF